MKNAMWLTAALLFLGSAGLWLFLPSSVSWFADVWMAIGQPGLWGRLGYWAGFWAVVIALAVRLGKSGPI